MSWPPVPRTEDQRLLSTGGTFVDDLRTPELDGALHVTFVRSTVAHASITSIDVAAARAVPGVAAVYTAADLTGVADLTSYRRASVTAEAFAEPLLSADRVRHYGEALALVLSEDVECGRVAAAAVEIAYEPLPATVHTVDALTDEILLFDAAGTNVVDEDGRDSFDDAPFRAAEVVVDCWIENQRVAALPLEGRAIAATFIDGELTVWVSTQNAQRSRSTLAEVLALQIEQIRVVVPDVGGGFGAKIGIDRDCIAVVWAALTLGQPVRWAETRTENLVAMSQGRAQTQHVRIAGRRDGTITAYRLDILQDAGAYPRTGTLVPVTCRMAGGVYDIAHVQSGFRLVVTNTTPINKYRGAGRPEATAAIERAVDMFATAIHMDPAEVRRRNIIPASQMPYLTRSGVRYDSGDYPAALERVLDAVDYHRLRSTQATERAGRSVTATGLGLSVYVEMTGGGSEFGAVQVDERGHATVRTGSSSQGQGHATAWAMLVERELGIPLAATTVLHGDTRVVPNGVGTYSSRSLQLGGSAVVTAARRVREHGRSIAADILGLDVREVALDVTDGRWRRAGDHSCPSSAGVSWATIAARMTTGMISADADFTAEPTFPFGVHASVVEVDTETGHVRLLRHVALDDAGLILNPLLAEGQRHGGIAQGIGQALYEGVRYDVDGSPLTRSFEQAAMASAADLPWFELLSSATATSTNPLGVKGIGESGTIGATPAVQNAVVDALAHLGVNHLDMPMTPERILTAIAAAAVPTRPTGAGTSRLNG